MAGAEAVADAAGYATGFDVPLAFNALLVVFALVAGRVRIHAGVQAAPTLAH